MLHSSCFGISQTEVAVLPKSGLSRTEAALGWFPGAWETPEKKEKKRKFRFSTENGFESHTLHM